MASRDGRSNDGIERVGVAVRVCVLQPTQMADIEQLSIERVARDDKVVLARASFSSDEHELRSAMVAVRRCLKDSATLFHRISSDRTLPSPSLRVVGAADPRDGVALLGAKLDVGRILSSQLSLRLEDDWDTAPTVKQLIDLFSDVYAAPHAGVPDSENLEAAQRFQKHFGGADVASLAPAIRTVSVTVYDVLDDLFPPRLDPSMAGWTLCARLRLGRHSIEGDTDVAFIGGATDGARVIIREGAPCVLLRSLGWYVLGPRLPLDNEWRTVRIEVGHAEDLTRVLVCVDGVGIEETRAPQEGPPPLDQRYRLGASNHSSFDLQRFMLFQSPFDQDARRKTERSMAARPASGPFVRFDEERSLATDPDQEGEG